MIVLVYLIVLLRELLVSTIFAWCIPTSPFIQLNDFYTCKCKNHFIKMKGDVGMHNAKNPNLTT